MIYLEILAALASVFGAAFSLLKAREARNSASEATRVRKAMIGQRKASELSQLDGKCRTARLSMDKYGPGSNVQSLQGIDQSNDAGIVQSFISSLMQQREHFGVKKPNDADVFCHEVEPLLDTFAQAKTEEGMRDSGKEIWSRLNLIAPLVKKKFDSKRENV